MGFLGQLVGGVIAILLLSMLLEWALFKRVLASPRQGIPASVVAAVVLAIILYGFGNANGGSWNPMPGAIAYIVGGAIVFAIEICLLRRREQRMSDHSEIFE